jgi:hypothetical protein
MTSDGESLIYYRAGLKKFTQCRAAVLSNGRVMLGAGLPDIVSPPGNGLICGMHVPIIGRDTHFG